VARHYCLHAETHLGVAAFSPAALPDTLERRHECLRTSLKPRPAGFNRQSRVGRVVMGATTN